MERGAGAAGDDPADLSARSRDLPGVDRRGVLEGGRRRLEAGEAAGDPAADRVHAGGVGRTRAAARIGKRSSRRASAVRRGQTSSECSFRVNPALAERGAAVLSLHRRRPRRPLVAAEAEPTTRSRGVCSVRVPAPWQRSCSIASSMRSANASSSRARPTWKPSDFRPRWLHLASRRVVRGLVAGVRLVVLLSVH